jgi:hypothetical protein
VPEDEGPGRQDEEVRKGFGGEHPLR